MVISITNSGYIKSLPLATYRAQRRGGVGDHRDGHEGRGLHRAPLRVLDARLPAVLHEPRQGLPLEGLRPAGDGRARPRAATSATCCRCARASGCSPCSRRATSRRAPYLVFATRNGTVKKTAFQAYNTPIKADGIIAINIRDDDELVAVRRVDEDDEILMVSHAGLAVRFKEEDARAMGRDTSGVRGMDVAGKDNYVLAMDVARPGQDLLVVTEGGYGKRTSVDEYRLTLARRQGRQDDHVHGGQGPAGRRAGRARARGARLHLPERHGPADLRARDQPLRPRVAGREGDEPARGRRRSPRSRWWSRAATTRRPPPAAGIEPRPARRPSSRRRRAGPPRRRHGPDRGSVRGPIEQPMKAEVTDDALGRRCMTRSPA